MPHKAYPSFSPPSQNSLKTDSELVTLVTPELDASEGRFLFLEAFSELTEKPYQKLMISMTSWLEGSIPQNALETYA